MRLFHLRQTLSRLAAAGVALILLLTGCDRRPAKTPDTSETSGTSVTSGTSATATATTAPAPTSLPGFRFTRDNFPTLNGSSSTRPMAEGLAMALLGEAQEQVQDLLTFSRTTQSYRELMNGNADLLLAAEPAETIWDEKKKKNFDWQMDILAYDGLVFIVNKDNPVDSLTADQIRDIYTGKITNWSQLGGNKLDIVPFQRNEEAGSQAAMKKLVMGDTPMMKPIGPYVVNSMGGLVDAVASFDGSPAAIGYTMYYYAVNMGMAKDLKILKVDGIAPSVATIAGNEYPFRNNYYVVSKAGLPDSDPTAVLHQWLLSPSGQTLLEKLGYVPAQKTR